MESQRARAVELVEVEDTIDKLESETKFAVGAANSAVERITELERRLYNLLARIHRDGGHYVSDHGEAKAVDDADKIIVGYMRDKEALAKVRKGKPVPVCHPSFAARGGKRIAGILGLKQKNDRVQTAWLTKAPLELFYTVARIVDEQRTESVRYVKEQHPGPEEA